MATTRVVGREPKSPVDEEFLKQLFQGSELLTQGRVSEARPVLERAHQLQPRNEKAQNLLGLAYFKLGLFDRAAEIYETLVRDNPVDATLRVNLGLVYLKTNALRRAMREFEAATDLQPDHKRAHNYLGLALAQAGEYGRAREHFLLAGSDAMVEKMAKAIAGERFARPVKPAVTPAPTAARPAAPAENQWGAQFGLDESSKGDGDATSAQALQATSPGEEAPPPESLDDAAPELPANDAAFGTRTAVPLLSTLAPAIALVPANEASPFRVGAGGCAARVEGELLTRLEGLVAFSGQLEFQPEMKRYRGRSTEQAFGEGAAQLVRARGQGMLYLEARARAFLALDLGDEGAYFREACVFAFEEPVAFENGKVPSDGGPDLDLVHLRGQGRVLLSLEGSLRSVAVAEGAPVTIPLSHLVGWQGGVTPRVVPPLVSGSEPPGAAVELSGEGFALIALTVR